MPRHAHLSFECLRENMPANLITIKLSFLAKSSSGLRPDLALTHEQIAVDTGEIQRRKQSKNAVVKRICSNHFIAIRTANLASLHPRQQWSVVHVEFNCSCSRKSVLS